MMHLLQLLRIQRRLCRPRATAFLHAYTYTYIEFQRYCKTHLGIRFFFLRFAVTMIITIRASLADL